MNNLTSASATQDASIATGATHSEAMAPHGTYVVECVGADGAVKWRDSIENLLTTLGKHDLLDKYLAGSAYTAAFYLGLISSVGFSAIAAADTMASHAGWTEAGVANAPTYSQATRPAAVWAAAAAGAKALSTPLAYSITSAGTIKGAFLTTVSTKDGTTGLLFSAGTFSGGDKVVANTDTLNVSYQLSVV